MCAPEAIIMPLYPSNFEWLIWLLSGMGALVVLAISQGMAVTYLSKDKVLGGILSSLITIAFAQIAVVCILVGITRLMKRASGN
jgi:hypothetical protein